MFFLKPILRKKKVSVQREQVVLYCVQWCPFPMSCSACMNYTKPHIDALSVQLSFYLICFLKDKYVAGCLTLSVGFTQAAAHCGIDIWNEAFKESGNRIP